VVLSQVSAVNVRQPVRTAADAPGRQASLRATVSAYVALCKPRIVELLLITAVPTLFLAYRGLPSLSVSVVVVLGGALAAGSANALNCYIDRDIDEIMRRTSTRPLVRQTVAPRSALIFGIVLGVVSVALFAVTTNLLAAGLTLAAIFYYVVIYTILLKRHTSQSTLWGGACGAAPVLIAWAAATGTVPTPAWLLFAVTTNLLAAGLTLAAIFYYVVIYTILLKRHTSQSTLWGGACGAAPVLIAWAAATGPVPAPAWLLFAVVFFWQPPHFWALAIKYRDDYRSAGIPMLPVVASVRRVLAESVVYSWLMVAASLAVWPWAGPLYGAVAIVAGAAFLYEVHRLFHLSRQTAAADAAGASSGDGLVTMRLFHLSLVYLTVVFAAVAAGAFIR
jgi:protoheme IX farnesyltransferase